METLNNNAAAIKEIERLAKAAVSSHYIGVVPVELELPKGSMAKGLEVMLAPNGQGGLQKIDVSSEIAALRGKPLRRKGTARTQSLASFIALINRQADQDSAVFADMDWQKPKFTAILNYNRKGEGPAKPAEDPAEESLARFGDHLIEFAFPLSEPWKVWLANNGKPMEQAVFAQFLEDHIMEVSSPTEAERLEWKAVFGSMKALATAADLIGFSRDLEIMVGASYKSKTRLESGEVTMNFETTHSGPKGEAVTIPPGFVIQLSIFYGASTDRIAARLRYRPAGGQGVLWSYELHRPDLVIEERLRADLATVTAETGLPAFEGTPET
jgi:uncharacterized protein YfdQ (DUF2303 family)